MEKNEKGSKIWLELDRVMVLELCEKLQKSNSPFAKKLFRELDRQIRPWVNIQKKRPLTPADSLAPEVLEIRDRVLNRQKEVES